MNEQTTKMIFTIAIESDGDQKKLSVSTAGGPLNQEIVIDENLNTRGQILNSMKLFFDDYDFFSYLNYED